MQLTCWKEADDWFVDNGYFRLHFSKSHMGVTSFTYLSGGNEHEVVNSLSFRLLYLPLLGLATPPGGFLVPWHTPALDDLVIGRTFSRFSVGGYLSNQSLGNIEDFYFRTFYSIYEDGDIYLLTEIYISNMTPYQIVREEHLLDPKDDADITLQRDNPPNLKFAGFYSNNTGGDPSDLSADGILMQVGDIFNIYTTYILGDQNAVGLGTTSALWYPGLVCVRRFRLHLSVNGSTHDVTDLTTFRSVGTDKSFDHRIPDPLNGGLNAGQVLVGSLTGDGYNEDQGTYTLTGA